MKRVLLLCFALVVSLSTYAQKTTVRMQDTQARLLDVTSNAYVQPLVVELQVVKVARADENGRIRDEFQLTKEQAEIELSGDLSNIRSWAIYMSTQKHNVDVIVAATFNIKTNENADGYDINVVGFPANFVNWRTAENGDYEWIRMEKTLTTNDREKISAIVK